jgi:hypothetical protein
MTWESIGSCRGPGPRREHREQRAESLNTVCVFRRQVEAKETALGVAPDVKSDYEAASLSVKRRGVLRALLLC